MMYRTKIFVRTLREPQGDAELLIALDTPEEMRQIEKNLFLHLL